MEQGKWFSKKASIVALACVVLLGTAVPVMADPSEPVPPEALETTSEVSEPGPPDSASVLAGYRTYMQEIESREAELEGQPLVAEREASRHAYDDYSPSQAEELLLSAFGETLEKINTEPSRLLSDARLDQNLGQGSAVITDEGRTTILEAGQPIETQNAEGETEKVDLSLEPLAEGFEPENPLTEVLIGKTADEGVEVGEEGLTLTQARANESPGRLLGDKNVFFGEVEAGSDTDLMVSPTARGVELFDMLRSVDSPEDLRFELELPAGDNLRMGTVGAAEVVDAEGSAVSVILPPHAEDAQGTHVSVTMDVEGNSIVLHVEHRRQDLAYPILVDPETAVVQDWGGWFAGNNLQGGSYWHWQTNVSWTHLSGLSDMPGWLGGLLMNTNPGLLNAGGYGASFINAPTAGSYLANVAIAPFDRLDGECPQAEPFDYAGYVYTPTMAWQGLWYNDARYAGYINEPGWGTQYDLGLGVNQNVQSNCWRELAAGGVSFLLGDWNPPTMVSASSTASSGWITGGTQFSINVYATDPGLGVKEFSFTPEPSNPGNNLPRVLACVGNYESQCPAAYSGSFSFIGAEFPKGEDKLSVTARSPTNKVSPTSIPVTIKVDTEPPVMHLNGQLMGAVQAGEARMGEKQGEGGPELSQPLYNLGVEATDGVEGTTEAKLKQSGVKEVQVTVTDATGKVESTKSFPNLKSPCSSCEEKVTYPIPMIGLTAGKHKLKVKAWDYVGNKPAELEREFEYIPATGLTEDDVTQRFLLPDGKDHGEGSYQGPELAVNVMNGNVVYHQRDVDVEGSSTDLEAELFYNSQLPTAESSEFGRGWTLSQLPSLKPSGSMATALTSESALAANVALPQEVGKEQFSAKLDAVITKEPGGGYSVSEEGGPDAPATVYDANGRAVEEQTSPTASVEYAYAGGHLSEIAVDDPGTTELAPPPVKKALSIVPVYVSSFGTSGAANGQFTHPADVALDAKGNEWVADSGNNRVEEFTPGGEFIKSLGSSGTANGQFTTPKSLAFDASGNLWVDDAGNSRFEEFSPTGTFIKSVGTNGSGNGQFNRPEGIAIAPGGHVWVADTYNDRIVELNATGEFIKVVNPAGLGAIEPTGIDVGPEGNVWVADWAHNRVVEISAAGELVRQIGSEGTGELQFRRPDAIAIGTLGEVWVGDQNNERVQELTKEGKYVTQFGSAGTGAGQFSFSYPLGIATDNEGSLFVTDTNNNRVEHWQVPHYGYRAVFAAAFGSSGTAAGQYRHPGGLAVDEHGNVWIPDSENNRLQELNRKGEFVRQLGSVGTGNGQFRSPKSIAFTNDGEFWVADSGNNRIEEFTEKGEFIKAVGAPTVQFNGPEAIAIAPNGHIWVADTYNHRIVELDEEGNFIKVVNPTGLGAIEPTGIAFGPGGNAWIADWMGNRVAEISPAGALLRQFGTEGTGNGQFNRPDTVAVDPRGIVYVVNQNNSRIQVFNQTGGYLSQFGANGAGAGQFSFAYPTGVAADGRGDIWVSDNNNRIQKWTTGSWVPVEEEAIPARDDPSVVVSTSAGLVTGVVGAQAGSRHYGHTGQLLTADEGPGGTTKYEYEPTTQMLKKITLPNGTTASIVYDTTGRATEVTVTPAGSGPTTTKFRYVQEVSTEVAKNHGLEPGSREVEVEPEKEKRTFYAIDGAGDVVKSWNVEVAPSIFSEGGTLTQNSKEKSIDANDTQELLIKAFAPEGVRSIQFIVNGSTVVDEKTCTGSAKECEYETLQWIVEPEDLPAGTMWIEIVITSRVEEHGEPRKSSTRWWVTVPYVPPPELGIPQPPKYKKVLNFREEYGLDLDLNPVADELTLHNRVWETIDAWWTPSTAAGQVATATWERWGVPLRFVDEQELEYREWLYSTNAAKIDAWVEATEPANFAGYYLDNRAGGIMYVGFLGNQEEQLNQLKSSLNLVAQGRVKVYPVPPTVSYLSARATAQSVVNAIETSSALAALVTSVRLEKSGTLVHMGATNVAQAESALLQAVPGAHVVVQFEPRTGQLLSGRYRTDGRMRGGDAVFAHTGGLAGNMKCSAGFGTKTADGQSGGQQHWKVFVLTAGHCVFTGIGTTIYRSTDANQENESHWSVIGTVQHDRYPSEYGYITMDAAAIETHKPKLVPQGQWGADGNLVPTQPAGTVQVNQTVCFSGIMTQLTCGPVTEITPYWAGTEEHSSHAARAGYWVKFETPAQHGDSGAPVWSIFGDSIGLISAMGGPNEKHGANETFVEPLLTPPGLNRFTATGVLTDPAFAPMSLKLAADGE